MFSAASSSPASSVCTDAGTGLLRPRRSAGGTEAVRQAIATSPQAGLDCLCQTRFRYTHRVAISNHRIVAFDGEMRHVPVSRLRPRRQTSPDDFKSSRVPSPLLLTRPPKGLRSHPPLLWPTVGEALGSRSVASSWAAAQRLLRQARLKHRSLHPGNAPHAALASGTIPAIVEMPATQSTVFIGPSLRFFPRWNNSHGSPIIADAVSCHQTESVRTVFTPEQPAPFRELVA